MALFTDGALNATEDLRVVESAILDVVNTEAVDLAAKIDLAQREIALELITFLSRNAPQYLGPGKSLDQVMVTPGLREWHTFQTLAATYRDAYFHRLNDRFKEKWAEYSRASRATKESCFEIGIGVTASPLPKAPSPTVTFIPLGGEPERTEYVAAAWRSGNVRGARSETAAVTVPADMGIEVRLGVAPASADGWDIYTGCESVDMVRRNEQPLSLGGTWIEAGSDGEWADAMEQGAELWVVARGCLQRG